MEIVIAAVVVALGLAAGLVVAAVLLARRAPGLAAAVRRVPAAMPQPRRGPARTAGDDADALARRTEMGRLEERLLARERALDTRAAELEEREQRLAERLRETSAAHGRHVRRLGR